jgi:hypothetical protein
VGRAVEFLAGNACDDRVAGERRPGRREPDHRRGLTIGPFTGALVLALAAILPGWAALAFLAPKIDRAGRAGTALALSPILGGALVALFLRAGLSWGSALLSILALSLAVVALRRVLPRTAGPDLRGNGPDAAWNAALVCTLAIGAMFLTSEWWRVDSDAWTHAPIVRALRDHGLPPQDPWYAGFPLQYGWLYHAWVAALAEVTRASEFTIMAFLAVVSLTSFALLAGHFIGRFHGRNAGWATAFVLLGLNGAFLFTLPVVVLQSLVGQHAGLDVLHAAFTGIASDAGRAEDLLRWFGAQTWFGNKFANSTPLSLGLAAYAAWLASLWRALERGARDRRELLLFTLLTAATGALHPVLLLCAASTIALWFVLVALLARDQVAAAFRLAVLAAVGAAAPGSTSPGSSGTVRATSRRPSTSRCRNWSGSCSRSRRRWSSPASPRPRSRARGARRACPVGLCGAGVHDRPAAAGGVAVLHRRQELVPGVDPARVDRGRGVRRVDHARRLAVRRRTAGARARDGARAGISLCGPARGLAPAVAGTGDGRTAPGAAEERAPRGPAGGPRHARLPRARRVRHGQVRRARARLRPDRNGAPARAGRHALPRRQARARAFGGARGDGAAGVRGVARPGAAVAGAHAGPLAAEVLLGRTAPTWSLALPVKVYGTSTHGHATDARARLP